jgi:hypothetical protein
MPRHEIKRADWDEFLIRLERADDERIVSVVPSLCDPHTLEVLTAPRHGVVVIDGITGLPFEKRGQ